MPDYELCREIFNQCSNNQMRDVDFREVSVADPAAYVREHDLMQLSDPVLLERLVDEAIARNPKAIADFKKGKTNALKSLVGQVMGKTGGRANPVIVQQLVDQKAARS